MTDDSTSTNGTEEKETHRLGTINRWDPPEGDWAAEYDWTRYRGPNPWPVPGGWVFKDPEGGGWWQYFGDAGVGHYDDHSIRDELKADESVADASDALEDYRGAYAYLNVETANPDEVSLRNPEDEKLEWTLEVSDTEVFRRVEPERSDLMTAVAEALHAYHTGDLDDRIDEIVPASGEKPADIQEQKKIEQREAENESLDRFQTDGGTSTNGTERSRGILTPADRQFLRGETDYASDQSERDARYRIRERFYNGILDLEIALRGLDSRDISMVMDRLNTEDIEGIIVFAEYLDAARAAEEKRERMLTTLDRDKYDTDTDRDGGGADV